MSLQARGLACARGDRLLFSGLDLDLQPGQALWVKGANGSGKSSLLRLLAGLSLPLEGRVLYKGRDIRGLREDFHRELLYIGHHQALKDDLLAWENVMFSALLRGQRCSRPEATQALAVMGLQGQTHLPARALSQGQRQRVALARLALPGAPTLLVLDEPFTALDASSTRDVVGLVESHVQAGGMAVYTTHQPQALQGVATAHIELEAVSC